MRASTALVLVSGICLGLLLRTPQPTSSAQSHCQPPIRQASGLLVQDINGDGSIDVSDPVALLNWQFSGGTPPVAPCLPRGSIPATGAQECWDTNPTAC